MVLEMDLELEMDLLEPPSPSLSLSPTSHQHDQHDQDQRLRTVSPAYAHADITITDYQPEPASPATAAADKHKHPEMDAPDDTASTRLLPSPTVPAYDYYDDDDRLGRSIEPKRHASPTRLLFLACVWIVFLDCSSSISLAPMTELLEENICLYSDLGPSANALDCKGLAVQTELALIRGWQDTFGQLPGRCSFSHPIDFSPGA
jgi:hypothetical protein